MTYTLTQKELSDLKGQLTRAKKKGPEAVVKAVRDAVSMFDAKGWPDAWNTWSMALRDAAWALHQAGKSNAGYEAQELVNDLFYRPRRH